MQSFKTYENGNVLVEIYEDGTKVRSFENKEGAKPTHPETIDVKISNFCDLDHICTFCHEGSNRKGKHGDLKHLLYTLSSSLPEGVELAIGGGNPLAHPDLYDFLFKAKALGFICNLTVNQLHVQRYKDLLWTLINDDLIKGLGISHRAEKYGRSFVEFASYEHTVIHLIAGIDDWGVIGNLHEVGFKKFLVLGYKTFGRGVEYKKSNSPQVDANLKQWYMFIAKYIGSDKDMVISFDNLGIEQLNIKRFFTDKGWEKFYMGDDGEFSMYIDAIEQMYSPTSRSPHSERVGFDRMKLNEFFQRIRNHE